MACHRLSVNPYFKYKDIRVYKNKKPYPSEVHLCWHGFFWNSTNVPYLAFTNSAVRLMPPSFSVQGFPLQWNVSYLSKCIDLILLRFLRFVFLDIFVFIFRLRVSYVEKHCPLFSRSLSIPLLLQGFPLIFYNLPKHTTKQELHSWLHLTCIHKWLPNLKKQSQYIKNVTLLQFNINSKFISKTNSFCC